MRRITSRRIISLITNRPLIINRHIITGLLMVQGVLNIFMVPVIIMCLHITCNIHHHLLSTKKMRGLNGSTLK